MRSRLLLVAGMLFGGIVPALAQDAIDAGLMAEINKIRAIDNHMHADVVDAARPDRWKVDNPLGTPRYPDANPR
jgi:hypothetical protein